MSVKDYVQKNLDNSLEILEIFNKHSEQINLLHATYAIDAERMKHYIILMGNNFNPNHSDSSYCFSHYPQLLRNLPKFLLEVALDTENTQVSKTLIYFLNIKL